MLLIFGTTIRFTLVSTNRFFCPGCGGDRDGHLEQGRRWFTLFFLPLIPLGEAGQRVRCGTCGRGFDPAVLGRPTTEQLGQSWADAVRALVAMVVGTGRRDDPAMRGRAIATVRAVVPGYDGPTLDNDLLHLHPIHAGDYAAPLAGAVELAGRERFLTDLVAVARAAGTVTAEQRQVLEDAAAALDITPLHLNGIIHGALDDRHARSDERPGPGET